MMQELNDYMINRKAMEKSKHWDKYGDAEERTFHIKYPNQKRLQFVSSDSEMPKIRKKDIEEITMYGANFNAFWKRKKK